MTMRDQEPTIHVAKTASFRLLGVMKSSGPIDCDIALLAIQARGSLHTATGADAAKLKEAIKDGTVIADIVLALLAHVAIHIVWGNLL